MFIKVSYSHALVMSPYYSFKIIISENDITMNLNRPFSRSKIE